MSVITDTLCNCMFDMISNMQLQRIRNNAAAVAQDTGIALPRSVQTGALGMLNSEPSEHNTLFTFS